MGQQITALQVKDLLDTISYSSEVELDFNVYNVETISLTGNIEFTTTNRGEGKQKIVRLICDGTARSLEFPADWVFIGYGRPSQIAISKTAILSLYCFGSDEEDIIAAYSVEP